MRHTKPTRISLLLMVASMVLLAAFQVFWLRKEYNEQRSILQKETDILFRNTIQTLEDSVIQKKITKPFQKTLSKEKAVLLDGEKIKKKPAQLQVSTVATMTEKRSSGKDFVKFNSKDTFFYKRFNQLVHSVKIDTTDSSEERRRMTAILANVNPNQVESININRIGTLNITNLRLRDSVAGGKSEILIVKSDSMNEAIGRVGRIVLHNKLKEARYYRYGDTAKNDIKSAPKFNFKISVRSTTNEINREELPSDNHYIIRLDNDSLRIQDINRNYSRQIRKSKINLPFQVTRQFIKPTTQKQNISSSKDSSEIILSTSAIPSTMPFGSTYAAIFSDYQGYLIKKILPQSLFSFFLLAITGLAFGAIYRNLQQQRRLTELKNDFISNVTHELKTPIATVSVAIEALQNFGVAQNPRLTEEYLEISKNELNRLTLLVDKVLKMSTFEQQGLNFNLESVNVAELVQQVLSSLKLQFEKYKGEVSFDKVGEGFVISADKIHLTNVIYNLLDNALKYSENQPEIKIELQDNDSEIKLSISDKGIGIPPEYQDKIFEKFFRVPTGNMHNVKGYGLGLNYVASVIKQHGGKIEVKSELNKGSMFTLTLQKA